jgi:urea transporter
MDPESGAEPSASAQPPGLSAAAGDFSSSLTRFLAALAGLFGFEAREAGYQLLILLLLFVAAVVAVVFAYFFLLLGVTFFVVGWLGGGWTAVLLGLFAFHVVLAAICVVFLRSGGRRPFFPGVRQLVRSQVEKMS